MSVSVATPRMGRPAVAGHIAILLALAATVIVGGPARLAAPLALVLALFVITWRVLLRWRSLLASMVLVILFIPIRTYSLPGALPINLAPYRLMVALVAGAWLASALIDPRVRLHRSGVIDVPLT